MWCTDGVTVMQREKHLRRLVETGTEKWPEGTGGRTDGQAGGRGAEG